MTSLHTSLQTLFEQAPIIGIGGTRHDPSVQTRAMVDKVRRSLPPTSMIHVGDANGVDAMIRWVVDETRSRTFFVKDYGPAGARYAYALRSVACVESVNVRGGLWISFPDKPCPNGIAPNAESRAVFIGSGNGSWPSLAYAIGLGRRDGLLTSLLYLPPPLEPPVSWGLRPLNDLIGWWIDPHTE